MKVASIHAVFMDFEKKIPQKYYCSLNKLCFFIYHKVQKYVSWIWSHKFDLYKMFLNYSNYQTTNKYIFTWVDKNVFFQAITHLNFYK